MWPIGHSASLMPSWPPQATVKDTAIYGSLLALGLGAAAYSFVKLYANWLIDHCIFLKGCLYSIKLLGGVDVVFDPSTKLEEHAKKIPNKHCLLFEDQKFTYSEVNDLTNYHAQGLSKLGLSPSDCAAVLMKNKPETIFLFYALLRLTVPFSLINTNLRTKPLLHCIQEGNSKFLIVDEELIEAVHDVAEDLAKSGIKVIVYGKSDKYESLPCILESCNFEPVVSYERRDIDLSTVAVFIFTSGTTGLPKAAKLTYDKLGKGTIPMTVFGVHKDDVIYSPLPFYHSAAIIVANCTAMLLGATFASAPKFSVRNYWEDCDKHRVSVIQYIGETCRYLLTRQPSDADKKHNVRLAIGNGLRKDIWEEFKSRFNIQRICEFYAATEGNVGLANMTGKVGAIGMVSPANSFGKVLPNCVFAVYDADRDELVRDSQGLCREAPVGTPGVLLSEITNKFKFMGYTNHKQSERKIVKNVLKQGDMYFNTGDLLLRDKDYYVYFVDRVGDTFRWKGENVSTLEVANVLTELKFVDDCTVYGVAIPHTDGRCGMAAYVLTKGTAVNPDLLKRIYVHSESNLPSYARPVFIRFLSELHLTGTFKHQKYVLQKEGYDIRLISEVYICNVKEGTYEKLTSDVHDQLISGHMKL